MQAAIVRGLLLGPVLVVVVMLVLAMPTAVIWVALAGAAIAVAIFVAVVLGRAAAPVSPERAPLLPGDTTLTSTATPVRATARENLASDNRWRKAFTGWRYGAAPKDR